MIGIKPGDLITFDDAVDALLLSKMLNAAVEHSAADDIKINPAALEVIRRSISLIEAVLTKKIKVDEYDLI